jgi:hypothetical protein
MDPAVFPSVEPLLDKISEIADQQLGEPEIQRVLSEFGKILGNGPRFPSTSPWTCSTKNTSGRFRS